MPTIEVPPYVVPPPDVWQPGAWWMRLDGGAPEPAPRHLHGWDYDSELVVGCSVELDAGRLRREGAIGPDAAVELVAVLDCPATGDRWCAWRHELSTPGSQEEHTVQVSLGPRTVGGRIRISREVVLTQARSVPPPLVSRAGSVLLRDPDPLSVALEGSAGRFPVEVVDFPSIDQPRDALWLLDVTTSDPHAAFLASVRLYLNGAHPAVRGMIEAPEAEDSKGMVSLLHWDVTRQLLTRAVAEDLPWDEASDEDSLLSVLRRLMTDVVRMGDPESVKTMIQTAPAEFEVTLQQRTGLLRDG